MKIFISWSGELSKQIGGELSKWIPEVVPHIDIFYSNSSLKLGQQWLNGLSSSLEDISFGICIITKNNLNSPWVHYEAGAIFHKNEKKCTLIPLLIDIHKNELSGPLSTFQAMNFTEEEMRNLVKTINNGLESRKLPDTMIDVMFNLHWAELEKRIKYKLEENDIEFDIESKVDPDTLLRRIFDYTRSMAIASGLKDLDEKPNTIRGYSFKEKCERYVYRFISDNDLNDEDFIKNFNSIYNFCNGKFRSAKVIKTPFYLKQTICEILDIDVNEVQ